MCLWDNALMDDIDRDEISEELQRKAEDLRDRISELTRVVNADETISFGKRIGDGTTQAIQQAADAATAESLHGTLLEVEAAMERLRDGTFGRCAVCGEQIPAGRLEFRPWSSTCVTHADSGSTEPPRATGSKPAPAAPAVAEPRPKVDRQSPSAEPTPSKPARPAASSSRYLPKQEPSSATTTKDPTVRQAIDLTCQALPDINLGVTMLLARQLGPSTRVSNLRGRDTTQLADELARSAGIPSAWVDEVASILSHWRSEGWC